MPRNKEERDYVDNNRRIINRDKKKNEETWFGRKFLFDVNLKMEEITFMEIFLSFIMEVYMMYLYIYNLLVIFFLEY